MAEGLIVGSSPGRVRRRGSGSALIEKLLHVARESTGMEVAWMSTFRDGEQVFEALSGDAEAIGLTEGATGALAGSYCTRVLDGRLPT